tara:strand:+ start:15128 stop:15646 length:519 start_codon:yes stop_codon:yes gene_type:complete
MAVLVSGRGSNMHALLDQEGCNIRLVCSHRSQAAANFKARRNFIPVFKTKKIDFSEWKQFLKSRQISRLFLLGFMRIVPAEFINSFRGQILNLHPSLLPLYPGLEAIEKSFQDRAPMGITVHHVIPEMDAGESIVKSLVFRPNERIENIEKASLMMTFREHYLVRRVGEKWN